jgi:hypothetical protein
MSANHDFHEHMLLSADKGDPATTRWMECLGVDAQLLLATTSLYRCESTSTQSRRVRRQPELEQGVPRRSSWCC